MPSDPTSLVPRRAVQVESSHIAVVSFISNGRAIYPLSVRGTPMQTNAVHSRSYSSGRTINSGSFEIVRHAPESSYLSKVIKLAWLTPKRATVAALVLRRASSR